MMSSTIASKVKFHAKTLELNKKLLELRALLYRSLDWQCGVRLATIVLSFWISAVLSHANRCLAEIPFAYGVGIGPSWV